MAEPIEYRNFFELINPNNEPVVAALFTSYGFDAELFEKHILPDLLSIGGNATDNERYFRNQLALRLRDVPVTVFSDASQYNGGRTFMYDHITVSNVVFHPKCQMILFRDHLRLIVGSCNITMTGLCYNAETVWHFDVEERKGSTLTSGLKDIIDWLMLKYDSENDALKEIQRFIANLTEIDGFPKLLYSMKNDSIYKQFLDSLHLQKSRLRNLSIVSPFYENDRENSIENSMLMNFVDEAFKDNKDSVLEFYFPAELETDDNYRITAPVNILSELCSKYSNVELHAVNNIWQNESGNPVFRSLHAKIIIAMLSNGNCLTMSGSTNFTQRAMLSSKEHLSNIEISVLEYGKSHLVMPFSSNVTLDQLTYIEKKTDSIKKDIFVLDAYADTNDKLFISFDSSKAVYPFTVMYEEDKLFTISSQAELNNPIEKFPFRIRNSMDLKILCPSYEYYYPIRIVNKLEYPINDLKLDFSVKMCDVIDYWAGKYRSIQEMEKVIATRKTDSEEITNNNALYFRHNLQRYFKALAAIKEGLEAPFYSEVAFNSYLTDTFGIKTILAFILNDYKNQVSVNSETFVLLIEIKNVLTHLKYDERDRLTKEYKNERLKELFNESNEILKTIYTKASKKMRAQYKVMLNAYELDIRK